MAEKDSDNVSQAGTPQEVDRIRDIIFGTQMRDYDGRFEAVKRDLDRLQQELERLNAQLEAQDSDQTKKLQTVRQELRTSDDGIRDELRATAQRLTSEKVDRENLGDLFIELGRQLKTGESLGGLLSGLESLTASK